MESILRIYLGRHGETDWNAAQRLQGWTDIPLNDTGIQQALQLGQRLNGIALDAIYCSALQRSFRTAELAFPHATAVRMPELNEQSLGVYEGRVLTPEVLEEFRRRRSDPEDSLDGGESRNHLQERIRKALDCIRALHVEGGSVLIVGHGGTNNMILQTLFGSLPDVTFRFRNTELLLIEWPPSAPPLLWRSMSDLPDM